MALLPSLLQSCEISIKFAPIYSLKLWAVMLRIHLIVAGFVCSSSVFSLSWFYKYEEWTGDKKEGKWGEIRKEQSCFKSLLQRGVGDGAWVLCFVFVLFGGWAVKVKESKRAASAVHLCRTWQVRPRRHRRCQTGHLRRTLSGEVQRLLKLSLTLYFSISDACIIYAFVSAIYQHFYSSLPHSTAHLLWWNRLQQW